MRRFCYGILSVLITLSFVSVLMAQEYAGSETCKTCHGDIYDTFIKTGHPHKITKIDGAPPVFPEGTSPGVPNPPADKTWNDISYIIGGFGWKARFMDSEGYILTGDSIRQYNLAKSYLGLEAHWIGYDPKEAPRKPYTCGSCHTTGWVATGENGPHQDSLPGIYGTWVEPGVRCEACHGPAKDHTLDPTNVKPPKTENCADCHIRGDVNQIDATGGTMVKHHEQYEELIASPHKSFKCGTCHEPHKSTIYDMGGFKGEDQTCKTCHSSMEIKIADMADLKCYTCHMPLAGKSADAITINYKGGTVGKGDLHSHIFRITKDTTWQFITDDGKYVRKDADGKAYLTMDFACLTCHTDESMSWAAANAEAVHGTGTAIPIAPKTVPDNFALKQNYPNPFNPTTTIEFDLPQATRLKLSIYTMDGRLVRTLMDQKMPAGAHHITISAEGLASGIYIYALQSKNFSASKKMIVLR